MKKSLTLFLMIFTLVGSSIVPAHAEVIDFPCTGGTYSVEMPAAEIKKDNGCTGNLVIDASIKSIGKSAFRNSALVSVVIPNSVTAIGDDSFMFSEKLTSVLIPNSVTSIGNGAFSYSALTSIVIPNSVKMIGSSAFISNRLTSIVIPNSITVINSFSFASNNLTSVTIPDSVIKIEFFAFRANPNLTSVNIPDTVKEIGSDAFGDKIKSIIYCGPAVANLPTSPTCPPDRKAIIDTAAAAAAKAAADKAAADKAAFDVWYAAQQKAAADKAAAEKAELDAYVAALDKEAEDQAAADAAEAAKYAEKITITCKKGSVTKKVSAVSPKCPKGYTKVVPPKPRATCTKSEISTFNDVDQEMAGLMFGFTTLAGDLFSYIDKAKKATKNKSLLALYLKLESAVEAGGKGRSGKSKEAWYALQSKFEFNRCYSI
jgi:hypothetical protein